MNKTFHSVQNRGLKRSDTRPSESTLPALVSTATLGNVGTFLRKVVPAMWKKKPETDCSEVVPVGTRDGSKSWATVDGVITGLTHYERVALNAMEERVLPPDVRIKIVVAQANAGEDEEEMEEDVKRLDGLVRTLALYAVLERTALESSRSEDISLQRSKELGKMLVAAVQLELFQMIDDICEAGDADNELFDDLCCDAIQEGARDGFVHLTPHVLLAPGSGYKRLLQIRKDQLVEIIADVGGIRAIGAHDVHSPGSDQSFRGRRSVGALDSACGSPPEGPAPWEEDAFNDGSGGARSSPKPTKPRSLSPAQHHRSQTERVRELLSSIDGLVTTMAQETSTQANLSRLVDLPPLSPEGLEWRRSGSLGPADSVNGPSDNSGTGGAGSGGDALFICPEDKDILSSSPLIITQDGSEDGERPQPRAFFPEESDPLQPCSDPIALAEGRSPIPSLTGASSSRTLLLSEVDWLIAGTKAALGEDPEGFSNAGGYGRDITDTETTLASTRDGLDTARDSVDVLKEGTREEISERFAGRELTNSEGLGVTSGKEGSTSTAEVSSTSASASAIREEPGGGVGEYSSLALADSKISSRPKVADCSAPGADDDDADDGGEEARWELASRAVARADSAMMPAAARVGRSGVSLTKSLYNRVSSARMPVGQVRPSDQKPSDGSTDVGYPSVTLSGMDADTDGDEDFAPDVSEYRRADDAVSPLRPLEGYVAGSSTRTPGSRKDMSRTTSPRRPLRATGFKEVRLGPALTTGEGAVSGEHGREGGSADVSCATAAPRCRGGDDEHDAESVSATREMSRVPSMNDEPLSELDSSSNKALISTVAASGSSPSLEPAAPAKGTASSVTPVFRYAVNSEKFVTDGRARGQEATAESAVLAARDTPTVAVDHSPAIFVSGDVEAGTSTAPEGHAEGSDHQALPTASTTVASTDAKTSSRLTPVPGGSAGTMNGNHVSHREAANDGGVRADANGAKTSG